VKVPAFELENYTVALDHAIELVWALGIAVHGKDKAECERLSLAARDAMRDAREVFTRLLENYKVGATVGGPASRSL
jgi:hypothetical protein